MEQIAEENSDLDLQNRLMAEMKKRMIMYLKGQGPVMTGQSQNILQSNGSKIMQIGNKVVQKENISQQKQPVDPLIL